MSFDGVNASGRLVGGDEVVIGRSGHIGCIYLCVLSRSQSFLFYRCCWAQFMRYSLVCRLGARYQVLMSSHLGRYSVHEATCWHLFIAIHLLVL